MDDTANPTGDTRTGELASGLDANGGDFAAAIDLPEGRIDPSIARAAAGGGSAGNGDGNGNGDTTGGTAAPRKRGRPRLDGKPPGTVTDNASSKKEDARNVRASFIEKTLYSIHAGVAAILNTPELELDRDDAKELGVAVAGVLALHKVRMTPSQEAYALLFEAAAKVYPPMAVSIYMRKKAEAEGKGKVLRWPGSQPKEVKPAPTPQPTAPAPKESLLPKEFDPLNVRLDQ